MEADVVWIYWEVKRFKGSSVSRKASKKCREIGNCLIAGHIIGCCQDPITILPQYTGENISKRFCKKSAISAKGCHESVQNGWSHCPLTKLTKLKLGALPLLLDIVFPFCKYARDSRSWHDGRASSGILPSVFQRLSARSQLPHDLILILFQFKLDGLSQGGRRWLSANVKNAFNSFVRHAYLLIYDKERNFCAHYQNLWTLLSEAVLHWKLSLGQS